MKNLFKPGDKKSYLHKVSKKDIASFDSGTVHEVYSTFALCRDAEWTGRLFVLELKEEDEEGIGTMVSIKHRSPAFINDEVLFEATIDSLEGNELICSFTAQVEGRIIATGKTGQKILKREKIERIFTDLH